MESKQVFKPYMRIKLLQRSWQPIKRADVVTGCKSVAGIKTYAQPGISGKADDPAKLLKAFSDGGALPRHVFQQNANLHDFRKPDHLVKSLRNKRYSLLLREVAGSPRMQHDIADPHVLAADQLLTQRDYGFFTNLLIAAAKVYIRYEVCDRSVFTRLFFSSDLKAAHQLC